MCIRDRYRAPLINSSVCVSVSVCVTFVVFTDCETCTRPISTNPGPMEAGEYGLTRGTCFLACRLEFDAVAGNAVDFVVCFGWGGFFFRVFFPIFFLRTHTTCCKYQATSCLIYLSTSNEARPRERIDRGRFLPLGTKASSYRGAYRVPLFNLSVYVCVTLIEFVVFTDCDSCTRSISTCLLYTSPSPRD